MTDPKDLSVPELLDKMMGLEFYLVHNELLGAPADLGPHLKDHLLYMIGLEKQGVLFASGPLFDKDDQMTGEGVTIIRAASFQAAEAIAAQDPFVIAGLRRSHVSKWRVNEGRISLEVDLSDGVVRVG